MSRKEFVIVLFITCIVVIFWVISNIYHERSNTTLSPELQQALDPLNPNFDQTTLSKIQGLDSSVPESQTQPPPAVDLQASQSAQESSSSGSLVP